MELSQQIEGILFWKAEPVSLDKLRTLLKVEKTDLLSALDKLEATLKGRGLTLVRTDDEIMLGTAKELSPLIEQLTKDELSKDLGKAGLETLSIILYQGPIGRAEIDYIRGVNSQFILRNLLIRGLIERVANPDDQRSFLYKPTLDLLSHLGVNRVEDLPEFAAVKSDIAAFKQTVHESNQAAN